jgi:formylglycine-generating enzyme required for sulfatase activity
MLVSNGEYLQFVLEGGYQTPEWWTEEGKRWIGSIKPSMPLFWQKEGEQYKLRTLYRLIDMPWDWPAEVNNLEARAFCKWKSIKMETYVRLPTEDEYYSIRRVLNADQPSW